MIAEWLVGWLLVTSLTMLIFRVIPYHKPLGMILIFFWQTSRRYIGRFWLWIKIKYIIAFAEFWNLSDLEAIEKVKGLKEAIERNDPILFKKPSSK